MTAERTPTENQGMTPSQHLRSEAIYRINSVLAGMVEEDEMRTEEERVFGDVQLQPAMFDPCSRRFRWLLVDKEDWRLNSHLLEALRRSLHGDGRDHHGVTKQQQSIFLKECAKIDHKFGNLCSTLLSRNPTMPPSACIDSVVQKDNEQQWWLHHAFMKLLEERTFENTQYYDGLVLRLVKERPRSTTESIMEWEDVLKGRSLDWVYGTVVNPREIKNVVPYYDNEEVTKSVFFYSQKHKIAFNSLQSMKDFLESQKECRNTNELPDAEGPESWKIAIQEAVARNVPGEQVVSTPVYDGKATGLRCGRLIGVVHAVGNISSDANARNIAKRILEYEERLADEFRAAALARIGSEPIEEEDRIAEMKGQSLVLHYFLRILSFIQDWESVRVTRGRGKECVAVWKRDGSDTWKQHDNANSNESEDVRRERWMKLDRSFLDLSDASWLDSAERSALKGLTFEYEYPSYAVLPSDSGRRERLERQYIQDQIDIWQILPKTLLLHRIRRHATQTAATAIMSRNMSHNIGAHVLARYASRIGTDGATASGNADHRGDFLAYLQRRMDFLAEVATSERAFWMQNLSLQDQIGQLNYCVQKQRYAGNVESVLLRFITGKEQFKATVEYHGDPYTLFACPGGEVGVHALFVILENIIRNSARHGSSAGHDVKLRVRPDPSSPKEDLLKVEIVDSGSKVDSNVVKNINDIIYKSLLRKDGETRLGNWGIREMQICAHRLRGFPLSDLQGHSVGDEAAVLQAGCEKGKLKYTIYLQRAKQLAVIASSVKEIKNKFGAGAIDCARKKSVEILEKGQDATWDKIAERVRGYGFVVGTPEVDALVHADLPVRTMQMSQDDINDLVRAALCSDGGGVSWTERLHRRWAKLYRDRRPAWHGKTLWGVAVEGGDALKKLFSDNPNSPWLASSKSGLIRARKKSRDCSLIYPLPCEEEARTWHDTLYKDAIAAAWVDHPNIGEFDGEGVEFGNAAKVPLKCPRRWISVEGAYSDSAHALFLNHCPDEGGWEAIAASVPRVAVLDERVQSESDTCLRGIPRSKLWRLMGVWVPQKNKCNLDNPTFETCKEFLGDPTCGECCEQYPIDFLIIHLTILERLMREREQLLNETLKREQLLNETLKCLLDGSQVKEAAEIILVTGRGIFAGDQEADPRRARYLPISALLECLVSRPSKLGLMRAVWSASKPGATSGEKGEGAVP